MKQKLVVITINSSWNIVNFRQGLILGLQRQGYRVIALAPPDAYSGKLDALGVDFVPIEIDKKGVSPLQDLFLTWRYYRELRRLRPDVILAYTVKPNIYTSFAAHVLKIPIINNVAGLGTAFVRSGLLTRIVSGLYKLAFRNSATVFFQNSDDRDLFVRNRIVRPGQARLLPGSGIDLTKFRFGGASRTPGSKLTFLLIARVLRDKGVGEYVEAARIIRNCMPGVHFQLLGFLDVENRTAISRDEVSRWVAEGAINYLGQTDDVRPFIEAADCVVLPSYREGLPRALLEGAAMGKPLIATDVPGCRHIVDNGHNGYLCNVRDASSLAEAMLKMIRLSAGERSAMGMAGRKLVEKSYDEEIIFNLYMQAIIEASTRGPKPGT